MEMKVFPFLNNGVQGDVYNSRVLFLTTGEMVDSMTRSMTKLSLLTEHMSELPGGTKKKSDCVCFPRVNSNRKFGE